MKLGKLGDYRCTGQVIESFLGQCSSVAAVVVSLNSPL